MKLLFNGTVLTQGGSLQAALNFIEQAIMDRDIDWHFAVSSPLQLELDKAAVDHATLAEKLIHCPKSPARNFGSRKNLLAIARALQVDAVLTQFGPAYVTFPMPHIMGFANSWATHANDLAIATLAGPIKRLQFHLATRYRRQWLKSANAWIVEAEAARIGLQVRAGIDPALVRIIPNGCRDEFKHISTASAGLAMAPEIKILYISSYYRHKNFEIVPHVAQALKRLLGDRPFKFILTIDAAAPQSKAIANVAERLGVSSNLIYTGRIPVAEVSKLYESAHIAFIPTLLESFSAAYSEAMSCGLPIVTTDLDFAHSICGTAALYFNPVCAESAAQALRRVVIDDETRNRIIQAGRTMADQLPSGKEKYLLYKNTIIQCLEKPA